MLGSVIFGKILLVIIVRVVFVPITVLLAWSLVVEALRETSPTARATASREAAATAEAAEATTTKAMSTLTTHHLDNDLGVNTTHATTHATAKHIRWVL